MDVYKRADGRSPYWQYDIALPDGTRQRCSTREKDKAKARKVMLAALHDAKEIAEAPKASPRLYDAVTSYVEHLRSQGKVWAEDACSIRNKTFGVDQFAASGRHKLPMSLRLAEITEGVLLTLSAARRKEGASTGTIAHELKVIRAATILAGRNGATVPGLKWNVPVAAPKTRWLSPEEWRAIYDQLDPFRPMKHRGSDELHAPFQHVIEERQQTRDLFVALTLCGGRWGEVIRLTSDTVLPGGRVRLYGSKTQKERIVPLPAHAAEAMDRRLKAAEARGGVYLFPSGNTSGKYAGKADKAVAWQRGSGAIARAFERSGVNAPHKVERDGRATIHSLRHTFASWCLQNGMSLPEVQELLGHGDVNMTRRYAHLATGVTVERAKGVLGGVMSSVMPLPLAAE